MLMSVCKGGKAYYAKQDADKLSQFGDSSKTLTLMRSSADSLKKSAEVLGDVSLYEKKKFKKKDEETGEEIEVEDYDWDAITKAVKTFVDDYNSVVEQAGNSETKNVLRNAAWMTSITERAGNLLSKAGITIGKGNKLEFDEEGLKKMKESEGMHHINDSVMKVAEIVDNNSAASEETAAVSEQQTAQVQVIVNMMEQFEI